MPLSFSLWFYGSCTEVYCQVSASISDAPHRGQAMRGGQHRVRREFDWWFGPSVEVLSLVPAKVFVVCTLFSAGWYRSVENYLSRIKDLQGIGPARQLAALDLEAANCLVIHFCF